MKSKYVLLNWFLTLCIFCLFLLPLKGEALQSEIQIILDSSRFSGEKLGESNKLDVTVNNLLDILGTLDLKSNISLRVYGGKTVKDSEKCENTRLLIPFSKFDKKTWEESLKSLKPIGEPSIYNAVKSAVDDFPKNNSRKNIILINFSPETCEKNLRELDKVVGSKENRAILHLIDYGADQKTRGELSFPVGVSGGTFFAPLTQAEFKKQIIEVLDLSHISGDLLIETRDSEGVEIYFPYQIKDVKTKRVITNHETNSLKAVKPGNYTVIVKTIPEKVMDNIQVKEGELTKLSLSGFAQLMVKVLDYEGFDLKYHYTLRKPDSDAIIGSADSGSPIFILEGKYKMTVQTIPFTVEEFTIEKGKKLLYTVRNLGFVKVEVKNKPETLKILKVVVRNQDDDKYIVAFEVPRDVNMVEGKYKFIFYAEKEITKENIVIKAKEKTTVSVDLANP